MSLKKIEKSGTVRGMGISANKKYAQVLMTKEKYSELEKHAKSCGFPSFSSWAAAVLQHETKNPKHVRPL